MRRPYRVFLPSRWRRTSFATARRAVAACEMDGPGRYVIEWHAPEGPWLPLLVVNVTPSRSNVERWEHLRAKETA